MRAFAGIVLAALAACGSAGATTTVTAADYRFDNLPATVRPGTRLSLRNASATEIHEMVVARLPDGETRPAETLVRLPGAQLDHLLTGATVTVLLRPPGGAGLIRALGDGRLTEKGRYLVICTIAVGADPAAVLATRGPKDAPPVAGGPPHYTRGMYGEFRVE